MRRVYIDTLTGFTYPGKQKDLQLVYCGEKYFQLKLVNI
jgi:hypothetical protein